MDRLLGLKMNYNPNGAESARVRTRLKCATISFFWRAISPVPCAPALAAIAPLPPKELRSLEVVSQVRGDYLLVPF
jgi:hypothetical protein